MNTIIGSCLFLLTLGLGSANAQESIVFSGYPISKVESGSDTTAHVAMADVQSTEYRVLIVKRGDKYYWASRENKEMFYYQSGIAHWFIAPTSGYVKIIDPSLVPGGAENTPGYIYMEHLTLVVNTITYWGTGEQLSL